MPEQATWDVHAEEDNISSSMPFVRSDQTGHTVFKKPHFAGSIDVGEKILFFFRETAIEQFGIEDVSEFADTLRFNNQYSPLEMLNDLSLQLVHYL